MAMDAKILELTEQWLEYLKNRAMLLRCYGDLTLTVFTNSPIPSMVI